MTLTDLGAVPAFAMMGVAAWRLAEIERESSTAYERTTEYEGYRTHKKFDHSGTLTQDLPNHPFRADNSKTCMLRHQTTGLFLLTLLLLSLPPTDAAAQEAAAQGWPTTEWRVFCYLPNRAAWYGSEDPNTLPDYTSYRQDIIRHSNSGDCDDADPYSMAGRSRAMLEQVSAWLETQGFRPPNLLLVDGKYRAQVIPFLDTVCYLGACIENRAAYMYRGSRTQEEDAETQNVLIVTPSEHAIAHELLHAVQFSYPSFQPRTTVVANWVLEGTAEAVGLSWADSDRSLSERDYSKRLDRVASKVESYNDEAFWRAVSREYTPDESYAYLADLFSQENLVGNELGATDKILTQWGGLYEVFPTVVAQHLNKKHFYTDQGLEELSLRGPEDKRSVSAHVEPVAANAYKLTVRVPDDDMAGLKIEFGEDHDHLHLIVGNERLDVPGPLSSVPDGQMQLKPADRDPSWNRNVFRTALSGRAEPYEFFVRVANVAQDATESIERSYDLKFTLEPLEPCNSNAMIAAVNRESMLVPPVVFDPEAANLEPGGGSTFSFSGLVSDDGRACTHHISALGFLGAALTGNVAMDEEAVATMKQRAEALLRQREQLDFRKYESMSEEEMQNLPPEEKKKIMALAMGVSDALRPVQEAQEEVVLNIYSPHINTWQTGMLSFPRTTRHGGLGDWRANAAANLVIRLPGTTPREIREGETYEAAALGVGLGSERPQSRTLPSMGGFYTWWEGEFRNVTARHAAPQFVQRCEQAKSRMRQWVQRAAPEEVSITLHHFGQIDCTSAGRAFQGSMKILSGEVTGTVTVEEITGAEVKGTFELSGRGTLLIEASRFVYSEGRLVGDQQTSRERKGPITIRGTFSAPNHTEGVPRMFGYRSVVIE